MSSLFPDPPRERCLIHPAEPEPCKRCASEGHRDGETYDPELDHARLNGLALEVWDLMSDQGWRTLERISRATAGSEASVSARLRDFRKPRFGGHTVNRRRLTNGTFEYQVVPRVTANGRRCQ